MINKSIILIDILEFSLNHSKNHTCTRTENVSIIRVWQTPSKYGKYHTSVFIIYYKVNFFKVRKLRVKSIKKKLKNVLITYAFVCIRMKKNVCLYIRVYYVLWDS